MWKWLGKALKWLLAHPEMVAPVVEAIAKAKTKPAKPADGQ